MKIIFLHPDLGLGGAERLIVDAAVEMQARGHEVMIFTSHHNRARAFAATIDGTLDVRVRGGLLPLHIGQRLRAPSAIMRMAYLAATALRAEPHDVVVCDLVAHVVPIVRAMTSAPIVFYCHFPDQLLVPRHSRLYQLYRVPIDRLEQYGTGLADRVFVNSRFTALRFRDAFPRLADRTPDVVYPGIALTVPPQLPSLDDAPFILSVSRFDPAKNLRLAVEAFAVLRRTLVPEVFGSLRLVLAGGYDQRLREDRALVDALLALARDLEVDDRMTLIRSPSDRELQRLLSRALCVVYTPEDEHFGLVPLEAMVARKPVVAVNRGGPAETVIDGETGFLCPPDAAAFAEALARLVTKPTRARTMGVAGRARVEANFTRTKFGERFEGLVREVVAAGRRTP